jgi:hypothetical protein
MLLNEGDTTGGRREAPIPTRGSSEASGVDWRTGCCSSYKAGTIASRILPYQAPGDFRARFS